jgi:hypothetical protein
MLEEQGAMDLIKILGADVQGKLGEEAPIGKLTSASLRVRGRLLPIELDLASWPKPSLRKNALVQYWQPSVSTPPTRETFLVPVLFARWNEKLPPATPNALLLESLEIKGTYRRIGTARLSSLWDLRYTIPYLHRAESSNYEDSYDDDVLTDSEASTGKKPMGNATECDSRVERPAHPLSPRQELYNRRMAFLASHDVQGGIRKLREQLSATNDSKHILKLFSTIDRVIEMLPGRATETHRASLPDEGMRQRIQDGTKQDLAHAGPDMQGGQITVTQRPNRCVRRLPPKETVAPHFYVDCLEDEDSIRYGCFIFDII